MEAILRILTSSPRTRKSPRQLLRQMCPRPNPFDNTREVNANHDGTSCPINRYSAEVSPDQSDYRRCEVTLPLSGYGVTKDLAMRNAQPRGFSVYNPAKL